MDASSEKLLSVLHSLSQVRSLDEITKIVRTAARQLVGSDGATFVLKDEGFCHYVDEDAIEPLWKGKKFPLQACISGWSMLHKQAVAIPDIYQDSRIPIDAYRPTFVKSLVMVPIQQSNPIGAIGNYWASHHIATDEEIKTLQALADTVAVAMENVKLLESLGKQITELDEANKAKDEFLMMVSHELRTPLNAIEGWASLIAQGEVDGEEAQQGLQTILRNAKAQNRIIDDLMDTSTIILNRISFDQKPVDVIPIIEDAIETLRLNAQKKNLKIEFENNFVSAGSREAWILGDPERLLQTFNNLLNNAIKFTPENGQIWVKAKLAGPSVSISIRDTGEGIPKDFLPYVFERFRQADDSLTRKHGGLGLGLAIVRHIVTAFAGTIEAQSEGPNRGATFTVQFPLYDRTSVTESSSTSLRNENASRYSASSIPYAAASTSH